VTRWDREWNHTDGGRRLFERREVIRRLDTSGRENEI
jgi:hypothetical protein